MTKIPLLSLFDWWAKRKISNAPHGENIKRLNAVSDLAAKMKERGQTLAQLEQLSGQLDPGKGDSENVVFALMESFCNRLIEARYDECITYELLCQHEDEDGQETEPFVLVMLDVKRLELLTLLKIAGRLRLKFQLSDDHKKIIEYADFLLSVDHGQAAIDHPEAFGMTRAEMEAFVNQSLAVINS